MEKPITPQDEAQRINALCSLQILDTPQEERFDRITRVAQRFFNVSISLVSLVDTNRQWFKSRQGLAADETPREISFCGHAILGSDIFVVPNALNDARFADNPLVTSAPNIRFYAGAPLQAPTGERIGTLCIIDDKPHELSSDELSVLRDLADAVEAELQRTHLLAAQEGLQSSENRIRAILETVVDAIITIDESGTIESFNPAATKMFGYADKEVISKNVKCLMPPPYRDEHDGYLQRYLQTGEPHVIGAGREVIGLRKDGSNIPMELSVSEMEIAGQKMFTGIVRDITERNLANQALLDARDMAERNDRMKSEFLNMVSHELRTPLTVILGYLPLLVDESKLPEPAIISRCARDMNISGDQLQHLIDDLLDLSKIEAGKMSLNIEHFSVNEVVKDVLRSLKIKAEEKNIQLISDVRDGQINADKIRLKQILFNLIGNAIKFTEQGTISVSSRMQEDKVEFTVRDTGIGISAEQLPHIFDHFHQVNSSTTRTSRGTGLGLAITKKLVNLHNGNITVSSKPGMGSTFEFTI